MVEKLQNVFVNVEKGFMLNKQNVHRTLLILCKKFDLTVKSLEINFVSSDTILAVNKKFLKHDYYTDIITFDYSNERNNLDGEIFISVPEAKKNSKIFRVSVDNELLRLIVHGILHLIGYDDLETGKRKVMKKMENQLVKEFQKYDRGITK